MLRVVVVMVVVGWRVLFLLCKSFTFIFHFLILVRKPSLNPIELTNSD